MALSLHFDYSIPDQIYVGRGSVLPLKGRISHTDKTIKRIKLKYLNKTKRLGQVNLARVIENSNLSIAKDGFYHLLPIPVELLNEGRLVLSLLIEYKDQSKEEIEIGNILLEGVANINKVNTISKKNAVAICMAVYNPTIEAFEKQIDSIIAQDHSNWILFVNDDCSNPETFEELKKVCSKDNRIQVFRNKENLGFYKNFETCLSRVGDSFPFIALADQDDSWYPKKLIQLIRKINKGYTLVYGDICVKDSEGKIIEESFKNSRGNHFDKLGQLAAVNTVSGASMLFKSEILPYILPFPFPVKALLHDQWISILASSIGAIGFVNESLQDYIQHDDNTLGFTPIEKARFKKGLQELKNYTFYGRQIQKSIKINKGLQELSQETLSYLSKYENFYEEGLARIDFLNNFMAKRLDGINYKSIPLYAENTSPQQYLIRFVKNTVTGVHSNNFALHLYIAKQLKQKLA